MVETHFIMFVSLLIKLFESNKKFRMVIIVLFVVCLLFAILHVIYKRYYYYGYGIDHLTIRNIWENKKFLVYSLPHNLRALV